MCVGKKARVEVLSDLYINVSALTVGSVSNSVVDVTKHVGTECLGELVLTYSTDGWVTSMDKSSSAYTAIENGVILFKDIPEGAECKLCNPEMLFYTSQSLAVNVFTHTGSTPITLYASSDECYVVDIVADRGLYEFFPQMWIDEDLPFTNSKTVNSLIFDLTDRFVACIPRKYRYFDISNEGLMGNYNIATTTQDAHPLDLTTVHTKPLGYFNIGLTTVAV